MTFKRPQKNVIVMQFSNKFKFYLSGLQDMEFYYLISNSVIMAKKIFNKIILYFIALSSLMTSY